MKDIIILLYVFATVLMAVGAIGSLYHRGERKRLERENEEDREELRRRLGK